MAARPTKRRARRLLAPSDVVILLIALLVAILVQASPVGTAIDRAIDPLRVGLLSHAASGKVVIVEMDAASTATIKRWPWPRDNYARVIDNLRSAGAASIVFDIDLGSASTPAGDRALAAALARADGLVALPTFGQQARSGDQRILDAMPLPMFRQHVALASVSIAPDDDGLVRHMPLGTMTYGVPHPTLSAYIAHRSGSADDTFPIDFSILPDTIPRLSFVAVRDGKFDPAIVRGRSILIGGTAIEMADRYATPRWRNLPGVTIQALATETLLSGIPLETGGGIAILAALLLGLAIVRVRRGWMVALTATVAAIALFAGILAGQRDGVYIPASGAALLLIAVIGGGGGRAILARFRSQRLVDEETGLPNRRALLAQTVGTSRDTALLALTVTNYDSVAAVLPGSGDAQLMMRLAERIGAVRADETVYRIGDASLALRIDSQDPADLVRRLRTALLVPVEVAGRRLDAAISFGVSILGGDIEKCLQTALLAAEQASQAGLPWKLANADLSDVAQGVSLLGQLDEALVDGGVMVHYQPKLDLATGRIVGAEALVRWRDRRGQFISPGTFIPLAEAANRIAPLTVFVLETVLADLVAWRARDHDVRIAVNISATLLGDVEFDDAVDRLLAAFAVPPSALIFEVTESASLEDPQRAVRSLRRFDALGIAISMDDYGTGQSTLSYLRELPLSELKIDQSFVVNITRDRREAAMVRSTIELAHELGLKVVAEGIEEEECLALLRSIRCDIAQGYLIGRPQPAETFERDHLCGERHVRAAAG